jgi:ring-1,2-phenylacetyl-CoA epoxidase subunit PaaB
VLNARAPEESEASGESTAPEAGSAGREAWRGHGTIFEVFRQERKGQPFAHAGSLSAPDGRFAEIYAREQYGRRQESTALWLVPRSAVHVIDEFPDEFDLKYRRVDGYSIKARLKEARAAAEDATRLRGSFSAGENHG